MTSKFLTKLSSDYKKLFETERGYDVIIYAGEGPNVKEIHAHSNILCTRSQYFRSAFSNERAKKKDGKFIFSKPNISPQLFNIILRFIYCGKIELENLKGLYVLKLLIAVDELHIRQLISHVQDFLFEHKTEFLRQNPTGILETVYQHEIFTDLRDFCLEKICKEPKILFNSDKFITLKAPLLELLLKRNDLNVAEIEIWESLLKWCFAQQNMKNDPTKWSKKDITKIERSLRRFIPLVRFYGIRSADFFYKVYCYKDILPQDLVHDLWEFHMASTKAKFSTLIETNHIPLFASWIDRKDSSYYNENNIPYEFKLLYRSSRDGFNTAQFHKNCDNKGATIWVAKIHGSTQLIGGYNPLDWDRSGWKNTADSFLFNFTDGKNISTAKLGYVIIAKFAVYCVDDQGPHMGFIACPVHTVHPTNCYRYCPNGVNWERYCPSGNYGEVYPEIGIPEKFTVENYEVFQVVKK